MLHTTRPFKPNIYRPLPLLMVGKQMKYSPAVLGVKILFFQRGHRRNYSAFRVSLLGGHVMAALGIMSGVWNEFQLLAGVRIHEVLAG